MRVSAPDVKNLGIVRSRGRYLLSGHIRRLDLAQNSFIKTFEKRVRRTHPAECPQSASLGKKNPANFLKPQSGRTTLNFGPPAKPQEGGASPGGGDSLKRYLEANERRRANCGRTHFGRAGSARNPWPKHRFRPARPSSTLWPQPICRTRPDRANST